MSVYAIILIALFAMSGGIIMANHGKPRPDYNFWVWLFAVAIESYLLYAGGFFNLVK